MKENNKSFAIKILIVTFSVIVIFKFTVGPILDQVLSPLLKFYEISSSKQERLLVKEKILRELDNASKKEKYFTDKEAKIISNFLNKVNSELNLAGE